LPSFAIAEQEGPGDGSLVEVLWSGLGGDRNAIDALTVSGREAWLGGPLAVDEFAVASVSCALLAAAELVQARDGRRPTIGLSAEHVALSFGSERHVLIGGAPSPIGFAALSRFVSCADGGWARTHGNYPHHAIALGQALGFDPLCEPERAASELAAAARELEAVALEEAVVAAGGCATAVRGPVDWRAHPAGRAISNGTLVEYDKRFATTGTRTRPPAARPPAAHPAAAHPPGARPPAANAPLDRARVLDLTRVIAGPDAGGARRRRAAPRRATAARAA
jgi:hypothetical protein